MQDVRLTICIPSFNQEKTIRDSLKSAVAQRVKGKEVLVVDDCSTDNTVKICKEYPVRVIVNRENLGIGRNLEKCMDNAKGEFVVYLCGDDVFTNPYVCDDIVKTFKSNKKLGVIGRFYYQFMDGHRGPIMVCRDKNILTSSCNPSGMAFRKETVLGSNKIFIEMPYIVAQYLRMGYEWTMLEYDTIAARIHPGGNTATKDWYYTESMYKNWYELLGKPLDFPQGYIQIKNRCPKKLWEEICVSVKLNKRILLDPKSLFCILTALIFPSIILRHFSNLYRHRFIRHFLRIIERG